MQVKDIMTSDPTVVTRDETVKDVAGKMRASDVGMLPVVLGYRDRELVGVITDRDIVVRHVASGHDHPCAVGIHMTAVDLQVASPNEDVALALERMKRARVRRLPVVDEAHRVVGILAQADLARDLGPADPERIEELMEAVSEPQQVPVRLGKGVRVG